VATEIAGLTPLLVAVPAILAAAASVQSLLSTPDLAGLDTTAVDAQAFFTGAGLFQDPAVGYTSNVYTPLSALAAGMLDHVVFWVGWPVLFNILGALALAAVAGRFAWRPAASRRARILVAAEAVGVGGLAWWLAATGAGYMYGDRPDLLAWGFALVGLAAVPAAATRSTPWLVVAVIGLSAGFWTKQPTLVASVAAVLWMAALALLRVIPARRALVFATALAAVNVVVLAVANALTSGWQYRLNFEIPGRHPLVEKGVSFVDTVDVMAGITASFAGLAVIVAALLWALVAARAASRDRGGDIAVSVVLLFTAVGALVLVHVIARLEASGDTGTKWLVIPLVSAGAGA
jgi:hypothetical protein